MLLYSSSERGRKNMKKIVCAVKDNKCVTEYELTYEENEVNEFIDSLDKTVILPTPKPVIDSRDAARLLPIMREAKQYDKQNTLHNYDDIKAYIRKLHASSDLNLTELNVLMKSNGDMRNPQICELFRNFLSLYTYRTIITYDAYYMDPMIRRIYELESAESAPKYDLETVRENTEALQNIGFSIEARINEQKNQKVIK